MMGKKRFGLFLILFLVVAGTFFIFLPAILRAIPSRYLARLPEPMQALAFSQPPEALPTAPVAVDASNLLLSASFLTPTLAPILPTFTALPAPQQLITTPEQTATATITPIPSATPTTTPIPIPIPPQARIEPVYHIFQDWNNCGPATMSMTLTYFNLVHTQYDIAQALKPNPEDRNVTPQEMSDYVNENTELQAINRANGTLDQIQLLIANGFPVILEVGYDPPGEYAWMEWYGHYLLMVAYDNAQEQIWVYDSWLGTSEKPGENADPSGRTISYANLEKYWQQFNHNYIVLYPSESAELVAEILGSNIDDSIMWQNALVGVQNQLNQQPENAFLWFNLGTVWNALGDYEKAATAFDQARNIGLPWRMLWYQFAPYEAYYQTERYNEVLLLTEVTLKDRPYFEESFYYQGLALAALGRTEEAEEALAQSVAFNPNFVPAQTALNQLDN